MKIVLPFVVLASLIVTPGCAGGLLSLVEPQKTYDGDLPLKETAVVGPAPTCQIAPLIMAVDDRPTSSMAVGYPRLIRLRPGDRTLYIQTVAHGVTSKTSSGLIEVKLNAEAGHTYLLNTAIEGTAAAPIVRVWIEDTGLNQPVPRDHFC